MKVKTERWGEVDAHYWRDSHGEGLYVIDLHVRVGHPWHECGQWNIDKVGPPPILKPSDFNNPSTWNRLLQEVLTADIEARSAEVALDRVNHAAVPDKAERERLGREAAARVKASMLKVEPQNVPMIRSLSEDEARRAAELEDAKFRYRSPPVEAPVAVEPTPAPKPKQKGKPK